MTTREIRESPQSDEVRTTTPQEQNLKSDRDSIPVSRPTKPIAPKNQKKNNPIGKRLYYNPLQKTKR